MHFSISQEMMREIIMDHYQNPRNKREGDDSYQTIYMDSTSCIDKIYIQIFDRKNKISELLENFDDNMNYLDAYIKQELSPKSLQLHH